MAGLLVLDASAMVDLLIGVPGSPVVAARLQGHALHVPAHFDVEVLSALGRLQRAGRLAVDQVADRLERVAGADIERHPLGPLLAGAWGRRDVLQLGDALYVGLAERLGCPLLTTDRRLATAAPAVTEWAGPAE